MGDRSCEAPELGAALARPAGAREPAASSPGRRGGVATLPPSRGRGKWRPREPGLGGGNGEAASPLGFGGARPRRCGPARATGGPPGRERGAEPAASRGASGGPQPRGRRGPAGARAPTAPSSLRRQALCPPGAGAAQGCAPGTVGGRPSAECSGARWWGRARASRIRGGWGRRQQCVSLHPAKLPRFRWLMVRSPEKGAFQPQRR